MYRKFKSIMNAETMGFTYNSEAWTASGSPAIDGRMRAYQTYGDGLTQHSGDWTITVDQLADYMASMAAAMLDDRELAEYCMYSLAGGPGRKQIEFAASIVFKAADDQERFSACYRREKKPRYYSISEMKLTSADKQYDKRFKLVDSFCDGTPKAIYNMLLPEYAGGLERYQWANAIHSWACSTDGMYMELPARFLGWAKGDDAQEEARVMRYAFQAVLDVLESVRLRGAAESELANVRRRVESALARKTAQALAISQPEEILSGESVAIVQALQS